MLAGTALDDTFLGSAFGHLAAKQALRDPMVLQRALNFESAFRAAPRGRVFPLLARHDQFIRFGRQVSSYGEVPVRVIERGHTNAALSPSLLRAHIVRHRPAGDEAVILPNSQSPSPPGSQQSAKWLSKCEGVKRRSEDPGSRRDTPGPRARHGTRPGAPPPRRWLRRGAFMSPGRQREAG